MTAYIVDRAPKLEGFPLTIYMCWQLTMTLMRIIINHGAMPDGINGLAQVNAAAELYRVPKTSELRDPEDFSGHSQRGLRCRRMGRTRRCRGCEV